MIVDCRCPRCNRPVIGTEDVRTTSELPPDPKACRWCKATIRLVQSEEEAGFEGVDCYHFSEGR